MKRRSFLANSFLALGLLCGAASILAAEPIAPVAVMPLGDSITQGLFKGGYRAPLCQMLTDAGYTFRFVGTQTVNSVPVLTESGNDHHEGHGGYALSHILNNLDGGTSNGGHWLDGIAGMREPIYPDIILLMIATNDLGSHKREVGPTLEDYEKLLEKLHAMRPRAAIIASTLIPYTGDKYPLRERHQLEFNAALPALIERRKKAGQNVVLYDMRAGVGPEHISADGVHPNQEGYDAIAAGWFEALKKLPMPKDGAKR